MEIEAYIDAVVSHAMSTGRFDSVNGHEPKAVPGYGVTAAVWSQSIGPLRNASSLVHTSALLVMNVRIYASMLSEPQDMIDPQVIKACDDLFAAYSGDFTLDGMIKAVDLLGMSGTPLSGQAGYQEVSGKMFRVVTITLPLMINDAWEQRP